MRRDARFGAVGAGEGLVWVASGAVELDGADGLASVSIRFLRVTERRAPLKTCACSFVTASCAAAGVANSARA